MKIKSGYVIREIANQYMAIPVGKRVNDIHGMIALNETGAFIWKLLDKEMSEEEVAEVLTTEYDICFEDALPVVKEYLEVMREAGVLEENA